LLSTIAGQHKPDGGAIHFAGQAFGGLAPERIFRFGLARNDFFV